MELQSDSNYMASAGLNTLASGWFRRFLAKKTSKRTWLCVGIATFWEVLQTWQRSQKAQQNCTWKKFCFVGSVGCLWVTS